MSLQKPALHVRLELWNLCTAFSMFAWVVIVQAHLMLILHHLCYICENLHIGKIAFIPNIHLKRVLVGIRSQPRYVQTQLAVSRLVYLGQFCTK